jgi:NAD(P)H-flavin reductase
MPDPHRDFYQDLTFIVAAARDGDGNMLMNPTVIDNKDNSRTSNEVITVVASRPRPCYPVTASTTRSRRCAHHAFGEEVNDLNNSSHQDPLHIHIVLSRPTTQDPASRCDSKGPIDAKLVQELVPDLSHADFYSCGSRAFMVNVAEGLNRLGVNPHDIQFETF